MSRWRIEGTLAAAALTMTFLSGCAAKQAQPKLTEALQKDHIFSLPPSAVMKAALEEVSEGEAFGFPEIERRLEGTPPSRVGSEPVSTGARISTFNCRHNLQMVPSRLWAALCGSGGFYTALDVWGGPGVRRGDEAGLYSLEAEQEELFTFRVDELRRHAESLSLPLQDISAMYGNEWQGHLPFMNDVLSYERPGQLLLIVQVKRDGPRPAISYLTIYSKK